MGAQAMPTMEAHVVLVDRAGRAGPTMPKAEAHSAATPLHLAFSCHVVDRDGSVLLTRRAESKGTWPGVWSNACCGHPQAGESLREAVTRRLQEELGVRVSRLALAIPDFAYRASMADGIVEHELCPVVVAEVIGEVDPDPAEVDAIRWVPWAELRQRHQADRGSLSPWSVQQLDELIELGWQPGRWTTFEVGPATHDLLDRPLLAAWPEPAGAVGNRAASAVAARVQPVLAAFLHEKAAALAALDPALAPLVGEVRGLLDAGGKRLRPAFVYWGHRATGADHDEAVFRAAAAVELLHTFALLHDDVMDRSHRRRDRPTAHVALARQHRRAGSNGDSEWFGVSGAVLAGDLAYVWADELLDGTLLPPPDVDRARGVFTTLREEVTAGQYLDLTLAAARDADERTARRVALLKSARYTVTRPLQVGAALAGPPDPSLAAALQLYGDSVGLAFQLRDDLLGLFGDPAETGKSTLDDLREGKRTMLVLRALRLADDRQRSVLLRALGNPALDEAGAEAARGVVADTGAVASVEMLLEAKHATAVAAIDDVAAPARDALRELAADAIRRRR